MWQDILVLVGLFVASLASLAMINVYANVFVFRPLIKARKHLTLADFLRASEDTGFRKDALEFAYRDLTELCGFPILRSDHLWKTLHLDEDELDDVLAKRMEQWGVSDVYSTKTINTVEDYVAFLSYVLEPNQAKNVSK